MSDERATVARMLRAVEVTLEPFGGSDRAPDAAIWAGSAAFWICALDEVLGKGRYGGPAVERLLLGIRFARDGITHGGESAAIEEGLSYPLSYPLDFGPLVWAPSRLLTAHWRPRGKVEHVLEKQSAYDELLRGRVLAEPLRTAAEAQRAEAHSRHGL